MRFLPLDGDRDVAIPHRVPAASDGLAVRTRLRGRACPEIELLLRRVVGAGEHDQGWVSPVRVILGRQLHEVAEVAVIGLPWRRQLEEAVGVRSLGRFVPRRLHVGDQGRQSLDRRRLLGNRASEQFLPIRR